MHIGTMKIAARLPNEIMEGAENKRTKAIAAAFVL